MKRVLICFGLLFIAFLTFLFYFLNGKFISIKPQVTEKSETLNENKFKLNIKGNLLLSYDGKLILLKGITIDYFRYAQTKNLESPYIKNKNDLINYLNIVHGWGANLVQIYLNPDLFDVQNSKSGTYISELTEVVDWGYKNNIYIVLNPVNDIQWVNNLPVRTTEMSAKSVKIATFLQGLSNKYKDKSNVIFGLEAEPKLIDDPSIIDARLDVISQNSNNPILVPSQNSLGSVNILSEVIKQGKQNIIVDYHPYRAMNDQSSKNLPPLKDMFLYINPEVYINYPTIFGEFGGFWEKDFNSLNDIKYLTELGNLAKKYNISFIAYSLDNKNLSMFDNSGDINIRGEAVKKLLENNGE